MSNQKSDMSDRGLLILTTALAAGILWLKYKLQIVMFIVNWRIAIALTISLAAVIGFQLLRKKLRAKNKDLDLENEIVTPINDEDAVYAGLSAKGKKHLCETTLQKNAHTNRWHDKRRKN